MTGPAILLAVENHDLYRQAKGLLLRQSIKLVEASGTQAILDGFQNSPPDLLILESPQNNGTDPLEIAEQLRKRNRRFPVILVTTHGSEARGVDALRAGLKDYFQRPFSPKKFIAAVQRCISGCASRHFCTVKSETTITTGISLEPI